MSENILEDLKNIKQNNHNLHQVFKQFVSKLAIDKGHLSHF